MVLWVILGLNMDDGIADLLDLLAQATRKAMGMIVRFRDTRYAGNMQSNVQEHPFASLAHAQRVKAVGAGLFLKDIPDTSLDIARWRRVHEDTRGSEAEAGGGVDHDAGDDQSGSGVDPFDAEAGSDQASDDRDLDPEIGGEVKGISLQGMRMVGPGDATDVTSSTIVDDHGGSDYTYGQSGDRQREGPDDHLDHDKNGDSTDEDDLDKGREALKLLVPVGMTTIGRLRGHTHAPEGEAGRRKVKYGMGGIGHDGQRASEEGDGSLYSDEAEVNGNRQEGGEPLLGSTLLNRLASFQSLSPRMTFSKVAGLIISPCPSIGDIDIMRQRYPRGREQ